jgi:hypothetical protein
MKKYFLILVVCLLANQIYGQELFIGGGGIRTYKVSLSADWVVRNGFEGTFEIKPFRSGLVAAVSPNILFDQNGYYYSLPFELKWLFGKKYKLYPTIGFMVRSQSFIGSSVGLGIERTIKQKYKIGIKCYRVASKYYPDPNMNIGPYSKRSRQFGIYLRRQIK